MVLARVLILPLQRGKWAGLNPANHSSTKVVTIKRECITCPNHSWLKSVLFPFSLAVLANNFFTSRCPFSLFSRPSRLEFDGLSTHQWWIITAYALSLYNHRRQRAHSLSAMFSKPWVALGAAKAIRIKARRAEIQTGATGRIAQMLPLCLWVKINSKL